MLKPSTRRILTCAVAVGVLFAVVSGVSVSGSAAASSSDGGGAVPGVETGFSLTFALIGLLPGALIGAGVGLLWGRSGTSGSLGFLLVTLLGGFTGFMATALLGVQTVVGATNTSSSMEHGAPPVVLIGGAVLGVIVGAVCAWRLRLSNRVEDTSAHEFSI